MESVISSLDKSYMEGVEFWNNPALNNPEYLFADEANKKMGECLAMIDMNEKKAYFNIPEIEKVLGIDYLFSLAVHEVGHHKICPYDVKTCLSMISEADLVLKNLEKAQYIENIYADLIVNTAAVSDKNSKGRLIIHTYQKISPRNQQDSFWNLYMRACERLWNTGRNSLTQNFDEKAEHDAVELEIIIKETIYDKDKWAQGVKKLAKVAKKYLDNKNQNNNLKNSQSGKSASNGQPASGTGYSNNKSQQPSNSNPSQPHNKGLIDYHKPKDFLSCDAKKGDKSSEKKIEDDIRGLAKSMTPKQYKRVVAGTGLGTEKTAIRWFYNDLASHYVVNLPEIIKPTGELVPETTELWEADDDINSLDIISSLGNSGVLIPSETTLKWKMREGQSGNSDNSCLDLVILLDSSGSMPDPTKFLSVPLLSSKVVAHSALNAEAKVAVINFSGNYKSIDYGIDKDEIDNVLDVYLNGGTNIPGEELLRIVQSNKKPQHILLISDAEISNLQSQIGKLEQAVNCARGGGTIFLSKNNSAGKDALEKIGFDVNLVSKLDDMLNLSIKVSKNLYGGTNE